MSIVFQRQAKELLAEATNCQAAIIPEDAQIGRFENWDSLAHLRLIFAIEQHIGRQLDPDESVQIESLDDISAILVETMNSTTKSVVTARAEGDP